MSRSLLKRSFDARVVVAVVLGLLLVTFGVFQYTGPEAALFRMLRDVPSSVRVVLLEPSPQSGLTNKDPLGPRGFTASMLNVPSVALPSEVPTLATLVVENSRGEASAVVVVERSVARRFGLRGVDVGGLVAVGSDAPLVAPSSAHRRVSPALLRVLRSASGVRVLAQSAWITRRFPVLPAPIGLNQFVVLSISGDERHLRVEGMVPRDTISGVSGARLLADRPAAAFLVLDGVPVSALSPPDLPELLEALRAETGVGSELRTLAELLHDAPISLVMQTEPDGSPAITVGVAVERKNPEAVEAAVRALLARRLALSETVVETVRVNGQTIRHARPQARVSGLEEFHRDALRILRAPQSAGGADLFAGFRDRFVVIGNSLEALLPVSALLRPDSARHSTINFFVDGTAIRQVPAVTFALRGMTPEFRPWAEVLGRLSLEISPDLRSLRFVANVDWTRP